MKRAPGTAAPDDIDAVCAPETATVFNGLRMFRVAPGTGKAPKEWVPLRKTKQALRKGRLELTAATLPVTRAVFVAKWQTKLALTEWRLVVSLAALYVWASVLNHSPFRGRPGKKEVAE